MARDPLQDEVVYRAREIIAAWENPGANPMLHQREKERLGAHWPALARRISNLRGALAQLDTGRAGRIDKPFNPTTPGTPFVTSARRLDRPDQEGTIT